MNTSKRVIILNRLNSPLIAQAIFILKDDCVSEFSAVAEAERIVEDFMENNTSSKCKRNLLPIILTSLALLGIILSLLFQ